MTPWLVKKPDCPLCKRPIDATLPVEDPGALEPMSMLQMLLARGYLDYDDYTDDDDYDEHLHSEHSEYPFGYGYSPGLFYDYSGF